MDTIRKRAFGMAIVALVLSGMAPPVWSMDGAILVVSAADGPMPASVVEAKIKQALRNADVHFSSAQLANLAEQVARALETPGGDKTICAAGRSPCITLVRE